MSDLTFVEKLKFERLLGMETGYVLNFKDRTFGDFVTDTIGRDIFAAEYNCASGSKANRLRGFWQAESNYLVGKLMGALLDHQKGVETSDIFFAGKKPEELQHTAALREECRRIVTRLLHDQPFAEANALSAISEEKDFEVIARAVRDAIERNEPETGLDRLHTFVVKYVRILCTERGLVFERGKALHSLFGEYVKSVQKGGLVESEMTIRILRSSISTLEAFNDVRNNRSLAHDNPILNYDEALLIFNHVASSVRFLSSLQKRIQAQQAARPQT